MSKEELLILIEEYKQKAKEDFLQKRFNNDFLLSLRSLLNGVFYAEGSLSFSSKTSHRFNPKFSIGQNASSESIELFSLMWVILDCILIWDISITSNSNFHIQLRSTNLNYILNTLIPYFSLTYGEKYIAGAKLLRIAELININTNLAKFETICLVYSLTLGIKEKLTLCINEGDMSPSKISAMMNYNNKVFKENTVPVNILFILVLGDGNLYIRIRDNKVNIYTKIWNKTKKYT